MNIATAFACALVAALLGAAPAAAAASIFGTPVPDVALARVRGGFDAADGRLRVSFGVERAVYVDGTLSARTVFQTTLGGGIATASTTADAAAVTLVQRGAGNVFVAGPLAAGSAGLVVQNTLDGQQLRSVTTIDITATSLQAYRSANWQTAIGNAVIFSLGR